MRLSNSFKPSRPVEKVVTFIINKLLESLITRVTGSSRAVRSTLQHGFSEMDE
jgi:hypothetical protein